MNLWNAIKERRSIRAFKPDRVPRDLIERILHAATEAPSSSNMQPWEFVTVCGKAKDQLSGILVESFSKERKGYDFGGTRKPFPEKILGRRKKFYGELFQKLKEQGIDPKEFLQEGTYSFWGAPVVILVFMDGAMEKRFLFDVGASVQNMLLAAQAKGLGTHVIGLILRFEEKIKEVLNIPAEKSLVIGVCLGYPDPNALINQYKPKREGIGQFVTWIGYEDRP